MTTAVTGASGFVGSHVVRALARAGQEVVAVVRPTSDLRRLHDLPAVFRLEADISTPAGRTSVAALRPTGIVHAAWFAEPGKYLSSALNLEMMNATVALATLLSSTGCRRFVGLGTCFEYETSVGYLSEATASGPTHLYSACKTATWLILKQLAASTTMQCCWARLFYLYGPDEHPKRLVPAITRSLLRGQEALTTLGQQVRDFLHVEDVAAAIAAVLASELVGPVNIGSGVPVTVAQVVHEVATACGRPDLVRLGALPYASGDPMFICANNARLVEATGWQARRTLAEGIADVVEWCRANPIR